VIEPTNIPLSNEVFDANKKLFDEIYSINDTIMAKPLPPGMPPPGMPPMIPPGMPSPGTVLKSAAIFVLTPFFDDFWTKFSSQFFKRALYIILKLRSLEIGELSSFFS